MTAFSRRRTPRKDHARSPRSDRRDGRAADDLPMVARRRSRLASDSSQLTIDSTIAAQIAVHQK